MPKAAPRSARTTRGGRQKSGRQDSGRSFLWRWRRGLFLAGLLFVTAIAGVGFALAQIDLPPERIQQQTSFICDGEVEHDCGAGSALAALHGDQDRVNVSLSEVPPVMVDAVLAAEDRDFFNHGGVDPVGIARALWSDLRNSGSTQGGSTITQQYVKNVYLSSERTFTRKIKEAVLSIKLEQQLTKEQILERYLNTVYFGRGAYGVGAAVRAYFGHDLAAVTLPEAAYLAGLIRSPETADGARDPAAATARRHLVLNAMREMGVITKDQANQADAVPWVATADATGTILPRTDRQGLGPVKGSDFGTEYFVQYVKQQLNQHGFSDAEIFGGGLRVYTTLDLNMQQAAWEAMRSTLPSDDDPLVSLVSLDPNNHVKALLGGRDFANDQVNLAVPNLGGSGRQPGSSFKPFVLAAALKGGISLQSRFNAPSAITLRGADAGHDWVVHNAEPSTGILDLIEATKVSSNTVFAQLMTKVKPENVVPLADAMGITTQLPEVNSLVLGGGEVYPIDMASAYSTFAHRGTHVQPTAIVKVERPNGEVILFDQPHTQPLSPQESDEVTYALQGVVGGGGTGVGASFGVPVAGKTGTTDDNKDAWFVGFTPNGYTTAVWMGYENPPGHPPRFMTSVHGRVVFGGTFPATIWRKYMQAVIDRHDVGSFTSPRSFPGRALGQDLTTTTSSSSTTSTSSTTVPPPSTPTETTAPADNTTTATTAPP